MSEADPPLEKRARSLREQQKRDFALRETVIRALMGEARGRRYVWLELNEANVFSQTFMLGSFDGTAFNEGKRSSGLRLLADVTRWTPESYMLMTKENAAVALAVEEEAKDE